MTYKPDIPEILDIPDIPEKVDKSIPVKVDKSIPVNDAGGSIPTVEDPQIPPTGKAEMLVVADSIGLNANFQYIEKRSKTSLRTATAYTALADSDARKPEKNFKAIIKKGNKETPIHLSYHGWRS